MSFFSRKRDDELGFWFRFVLNVGSLLIRVGLWGMFCVF